MSQLPLAVMASDRSVYGLCTMKRNKLVRYKQRFIEEKKRMLEDTTRVVILCLLSFLLYLSIPFAEVNAGAAGGKYTVIFDGNGASGRMKKQKVAVSGEKLRLPECSYSMEGCSFKGWMTAPFLTKDSLCFAPGETIDPAVIPGNGKKITVYACWKCDAPKDLYVDDGGSDDNDGSENRPFASIEKAIEEADPGSVIHVMPGVYDGGVYVEKSGLNTDPITIVGEGRDEEGKPLAKLRYSGNDKEKFVLDFDGHSNFNIINLDIGDVEGKYVCGIFIIQDCKNILISGNYIHDMKVADKYLVSPEENEKMAGEANAILCLGEGRKEKNAIEYITICDNEVCNNVTNWSESVSVAGNAQYVRVFSNVVHDNTNIGIDFNGNTGYCRNPKFDRPRKCEAYNNLVYNCHCDYAECAGIYADGASDISFHDNEVYGCDYGMEVGAEIKKKKYPVRNVVVSGNYIHENRDGGLVIGGYEENSTGMVQDCVIENNLIKDNLSDGICISRCRDTVFRNNHIMADPSVFIIKGEMSEKHTYGLTFEDNIYENGEEAQTLCFRWHEKDITGILEFNLATGGSDKAG